MKKLVFSVFIILSHLSLQSGLAANKCGQIKEIDKDTGWYFGSDYIYYSTVTLADASTALVLSSNFSTLSTALANNLNVCLVVQNLTNYQNVPNQPVYDISSLSK